MPFFAKGDFTMGVFSEIAMEQQNSMFDSSAAFEDDEAFELEEMESLPVPPVGTDTVPVSAASVSAGETALADAEEEPVDEVASDGEEKSAEEGNSAQPPAAEDEEKKRAEHEAAEAQRKAEFDAKQQAKKAAEQEQIARLEAMSDEEVIAASTQRVSTDVEKLTRRNMKECVSEHIQMLCILSARRRWTLKGCRRLHWKNSSVRDLSIVIWTFTVWTATGLKSSAWMGLVKSPGSAFGTLSSRAGIPPLNGI